MKTPAALNLNLQRRLDGAQRGMALSIARLSSGLRIQGARDDAAGLAIAERLHAQVRGTGVAIRNANDSISLLQTADGALGRVGELLQRLRELAVQGANASPSASDRALLREEASQLVREIDGIALRTRFNGQPLLDGSFKKLSAQVGADANEVLVVGALVDARPAHLPSLHIAYSINDDIDVSNSAPGPPEVFGAMPASGLTAIDGGLTVADADGQPIDLGKIAKASSGLQRLGQVVAAINGKTGETGVWATLEAGTTAGHYKVTLIANRNLDAAAFGGFGASVTGLDSGLIASAPIRSEPIDEVDLSTANGAREAIRRYDRAIGQVSQSRAMLGAMQSRFDAAIANLHVSSEQQQAARGRIMDADFAAETAHLARSAILQQAGMAMTAQANQLPAQVLQLLMNPVRAR